MKKKVLVVLLNLSLLLTGCGNTDLLSESKNSEDGSSTSAESSLSADDMFTERDMETNYDESTSASITLSGNTAQSDSDAVEISGSTVTITDEGTYILSGTLDDGMIVVAAEKTDKVQLVLDNVQIQCSTSAALYVQQADKVFVTLGADSTNTLTNGGEYVAVDDNNIDSVIFSKDDLTLNGTGSLAVEAGAGHGIVSKDDLVITGGTYQITSASHGISAQDSIRIADGNFTISSGKDGIHSENTEDTDLGYLYIAKGTFEITSETDSLSAGSILQIEDGNYTLTAGGGSENAEAHQEDGGFAPGNRGKMPEGGPDMAGGNQEMPEMPDGSQEMPEMPEMADGNQEMPEMPGDSEGFPKGNDDDSESTEIADADKANTEANTEENTSSAGDSETTSSEEATASTKGIKADGNIILHAGTFQIDSADDAVHSNANITVDGGSYQITTGDDGFHADSQVSITDGDLNITKSYEGIEGQNIKISGVNIQVVASDDGLNAAGGNDESGIAGNKGMDNFSGDSDCYIQISGGVMYINASGDGIDSNGNLTVSGGETYVSGSENGGNAALDYGGEASISGGIFVATGASQMAQNFGEDSEQGVMLVTVDSQESNSTLQLKDSSGNVLVEYTPTKAYDSAVVSAPELIKGESYTLVTGTAETSVTMDSLVYGESSMGMGGAPGGKQMDGERRTPKEMPQEAPQETQ